jgi:hypothetical protein
MKTLIERVLGVEFHHNFGTVVVDDIWRRKRFLITPYNLDQCNRRTGRVMIE